MHGAFESRGRLATSPDGVNWTMVSGLAASQGSVPDVVRRGDTLYVFTPNRDTGSPSRTSNLDGPLHDPRVYGR